MQLSLVFFTVLSQLAVGLALFAAIFAPFIGMRHTAEEKSSSTQSQKSYYFVILIILALAMLSSVFHLGHPLGAMNTLANLSSSWLSREILFFGIFGLSTLLTWFTGNRIFIWISAISGLLAVGATGMGYGPEAQVAIHNRLPLVFFLLTTLALGSIASSYVVPQATAALLRQICLCSLFAMLVLYAVIPSVWVSGNVVMQATAQLWLSSPIYWLRFVVGIIVPIILLMKKKHKLDKAILPLILIGELMGRAVFFNTAHSAMFLGELYS